MKSNKDLDFIHSTLVVIIKVIIILLFFKKAEQQYWLKYCFLWLFLNLMLYYIRRKTHIYIFSYTFCAFSR